MYKYYDGDKFIEVASQVKPSDEPSAGIGDLAAFASGCSRFDYWGFRMNHLAFFQCQVYSTDFSAAYIQIGANSKITGWSAPMVYFGPYDYSNLINISVTESIATLSLSKCIASNWYLIYWNYYQK